MRKPLVIHRIKQPRNDRLGQISILEHVRWCRANLGQRGIDWDFTGSANLEISIYTAQAATFYTLKFPAAEVQK